MHNALFTLNKGSLVLSVALSLMLLVAATEGVTAGEDKAITALYEAAKKEAQVTVYAPQEAVLQGLEKEFPLTLRGSRSSRRLWNRRNWP